MFEYVKQIVDGIEGDGRIDSRQAALDALRRIGLDDFGNLLLNMPSVSTYPRLSKLLPAMAPDATQIQWTGQAGAPLLLESLDFVRSLTYNYTAITKRPVTTGTRVLDYGCGWGRLLRLMSYFVDEADMLGVDPWDRSLEECANCGINNVALSDYLPQSLPVDGRLFDLAYAFSVFTHTSRRATLAALSAIRACMAPSGVLVMTIRPVEYWSLTQAIVADKQRAIAIHHQDGFMFDPHALEPIDGDVTYGDTSMSFDWLAKNAKGWRQVAIDRSLKDPYQIYVFLQAE